MIYSVHMMRFFASFAVLFWHATSYYVQSFKVGAAGVDMFFVISGLVIGLSTRDGDDPRTFVMRRLIRVMPMYWIATAVYAGFRYWAWKSVPDTELLVRSVVLVPRSGVDWSPIYWPAWSVCYELFFYVVMALVLLTVRRPATQVCMLVVTLTAVVRVPVPWDPGKYFQSDWGLEFVAGLLICEALKRGVKVERRIGIACIVLSIAVFALNSGQNALPRILVWGVPSVLAIVGVLAFEHTAWVRSQLVRLGGDISYTVYLFHITLIEYTRELAAHFGINVDIHPVRFVVGEIVAALLVAIAVNRWIERPLLDALRRCLIPPRAVVPTGLRIEQEASAVHSYSA